MPITLPKIDDRRYDDLVSEALARVPVHTPEWTNFNQSDPGVTLIGVFAFLTESLLYRANLIPERMRAKFLQLLRIPLRTATAATGLVTITNDAAAESPQAMVLNEDLEVRAGEVPFRTTRAVDVLPIEGRLYVKKKVTTPSADLLGYYRQLYASYRGNTPDFPIELYETVPFPTREGTAVSLADDTTDGSFWLALLVREADMTGVALANVSAKRTEILRAIENRTLTLGVVPSQSTTEATVPAGRPFGSQSSITLNAFVPKVDKEGGLGPRRIAEYQPTPTTSDVDVFSVAGTVDIALPAESKMRLWNDLDPLEPGVDALPPQIDDEKVDTRIATWVRLTPSATTKTTFLWMGINAVPVTQRTHVAGERLSDGTGEPDQVVRLALAPVLPDTVEIAVTPLSQAQQRWTRVDDLSVAPPEVPLPDPTQAKAPLVARDDSSASPPEGLLPDTRQEKAQRNSRAEKSPHVFLLDAESGEVRFGDGTHGARPPERAILRATYDYALGAKGNVGAAAINSAPALSAGFKVKNPFPVRGGADAETVAEGEKQISRYLQHRNRLVTVRDFEALTLRTPGVDVARVEVLPSFSARTGTEAPGVVTLMLVPAADPEQPDAPLPRTPFLEAVCRHLDPRRLITTELLLRGPEYVGVYISIGVKVEASFNDSQVTEAVKQDVIRFLAPFTSGRREQLPDADPVVVSSATPKSNGWKLGKPVVAAELLAVANRTRGVEFAGEAKVADKEGNEPASKQVEMLGLQLPRILGIRVTNGPAAAIGELMGGAGVGGSGVANGGAAPGGGHTVSVPVIPEECRC